MARKARTTALLVRLTPEELAAVHAVSEAEGLTASSWVRRLIHLASTELRGRT